MAAATFDQLKKDIKAKSFKPIYLLHGEESYYIDELSTLFAESILEDHEREFNQTIFYGKDANVGHIIESAKRYPMMASHQVVIVREAQQLDKADELEAYVSAPLDSTIFIYCHKNKAMDKRKALYKAFDKKGEVMLAKKLYDNQVPKWTTDYVASKGYKISQKACMILTEYLGNDLSKVSNEVDKIFINIEKGSEITPDVIQKQVGISKDYNIFELNNAIGSLNVTQANKIAHYFAQNPKAHPFVVTVSMLYTYFSKILAVHFAKDKSDGGLAKALGIGPYFVKDYKSAAANYHPKKLVVIIELLKTYDLKSKGVQNPSTPDGELLRELIYKIMH